VDDDVLVSQALVRDLRRQYAQRFRVVRADSGRHALEILRELRLAEEETALLLADHRMPGMTGVEFLEHSLELYPGAKRVLLTAYADIDAAIHAINTVGLDYYLLKPGARRSRSFTRSSTICWMTGRPTTSRRSKACA
jgi:thioredoxin reductase (NADPH)